MIRLYINEKEVDLDKSVNIPLTFQFEDLTNPTAVQNSFSKTVRLPSTPNNDQLFNHIYRLDHQIFDFDASKRIPFVLSWNAAVIETGYIKMTSIDYRDSYPDHYNIQLYGGLGDFFYEISEKNIDELNVNPENYNHVINADTVINSWSNDFYKYGLTYSGGYDNFEKSMIDGFKSYDSYLDVNITSFTGNAAYVDALIAVGNQFLATSTASQQYKEFFNQLEGRILWLRSVQPNYVTSVLDPHPPANSTVLAGGSFIMAIAKNGLGEFVVYPTDWNIHSIAYGNGYFVAVGESALLRSTTGEQGSWQKYGAFTDTLKSVYFNPDNSTFYMVSSDGYIYSSTNGAGRTPINFPDEGKYSFNSICTFGSYGYIVGEDYIFRFNLSGPVNFLAYAWTGYSLKSITHDETNVFFCGAKRQTATNGLTKDEGIIVKLNAGSMVREYMEEFSSSVNKIFYTKTVKYLALGNDGLILKSDTGVESSWKRGTNLVDPGDIPEYDEHEIYEYRSYYQRPFLKMHHMVDQIFADSSYAISKDDLFFNDANPYWSGTWCSMDRLTQDTNELTGEDVGNIRSGATVDFKLMVKNGVSQFKFLTDYTKPFGLIYVKDKFNKTVNIMTRNTFFSDYEILDWTDKIDYSKSLSIYPLTFNFKYGVLKWGDSNTFYEDQYINKYNISYGSTRVDTGYEFNKTNKDFIENQNFKNGIMSQEYDYYFRTSDDYRHDKILPAMFQKSDNRRDKSNTEMSLFFYQGLESTGNNRFAISDDTENMRRTLKYCWTFEGYRLTTNYPRFARVIPNSVSLDFSKPSESYESSITDSNYPESATIYYRLWQKYLEERFNSNNKQVDAYFYLDPIDISNFKFNKFIQIKNTLWHVNKIIDYDVTRPNRSTKVELIRVYDINAYTSGQILDTTPVPVLLSQKVDIPTEEKKSDNQSFKIEFADK